MVGSGSLPKAVALSHQLSLPACVTLPPLLHSALFVLLVLPRQLLPLPLLPPLLQLALPTNASLLRGNMPRKLLIKNLP